MAESMAEVDIQGHNHDDTNDTTVNCDEIHLAIEPETQTEGNDEQSAAVDVSEDERYARYLQSLEDILIDTNLVQVVPPGSEANLDETANTMSDDEDNTLEEILAALGDVGDAAQFLETQLDLLRAFDNLDEEHGHIWMRLMRTHSIRSRRRHRPVKECQVCLDSKELDDRPCCGLPVCDECLRSQVETNLVDVGQVRVACPNPTCDRLIYQDEIRELLRNNVELRDRYDRWLVDMNADPHCKTCPRCCHITNIDPSQLRDHRTAKWGLQVECTECHLEWCFPCQAPWHYGITCKKYRGGDVLLKEWVSQYDNGQRNAQRCPKCKVYIQRNEGCDHMTCSRCNTEFCYRCGCRRLTLRLFGYTLEDHDERYSIIGCNQTYKPDKPFIRALTRGTIFGAKVVGGIVAAPIVIGIAGAVVGIGIGVAAVAAPAYGTYRIASHIRKKIRDAKEV